MAFANLAVTYRAKMDRACSAPQEKKRNTKHEINLTSTMSIG